MPPVLNVFLRGTFAFFSLLILTRLLGKKQISQLTFFDYVAGITIGSIAASMSTDLSIETIHSFAALLTWSFWPILLAIIGVHSLRWRRIIDGEPTLVIQNGQILESNLKQLNYNIDDLRMQLRNKKIFSIADVEFALLEPNGKLSVLPKSQLQPATPTDLNISTSYKGLSVALIQDSHILDDNLVQLKLTREWLMEQLSNRNLSLDRVFYAELDTSGNLYVDLRDDLDKLPQEQDISDL